MLDYGMIGNCRTCALVNKRASIEWMCFPDFDSPSVFAKILDKERGGSFEIIPKGKYAVKQSYLEKTNILETVFESEGAAFKVIDFFPRYLKLIPGRRKVAFRQNRLVRIVKPLKGKPVFEVRYEPKLNYALGETVVIKEDGCFLAGELNLITNCEDDVVLNGKEVVLEQTKYFVVGVEDKAAEFSVAKCLKLLSWTKRYWRGWVGSLVLPEKNDLVIRSALVLKLLTFSETGAVIAAPTTSIPEISGTSQTWDFRYCWIRDSSFVVRTLKKLGRGYEARKLLEFMIGLFVGKRERLQLMYGIRGEKDLEEKELSHLAGFKGWGPVRIGNKAYEQVQYDIYGELIEILYLYFVFYKYKERMAGKYWRLLIKLVSAIKRDWKKKDQGIWELRERKEHFTFSKLSCWMGMDKAVKIAEYFGKDELVNKWQPLREGIKEDILKKAWDDKVGAFTMFYGSGNLDASLLLMCYYDFLERDDPRLVGMVEKINKVLRKGARVQRYELKGDVGKRGVEFGASIFICSFWLVDALYVIGKEKEARKLFDKILSYGNHLGLFSEDIDLKTGKLMGNFPQAYTHLALIDSVLLLKGWGLERQVKVGKEYP